MKPHTRVALDVASTCSLPVFPVNPRTKRPYANATLARALGEKPPAQGQGGYKFATTDPQRIEAMFEAVAGAAVAVPMGSMSGLACIDVDLYKGPEVEAWHEANAQLLPSTLTHATQSGGLHYLFQMTPHLSSGVLAPGVDLKAEGGYVLWPPSQGYRVEHAAPPAPFPLELLAKPVARERSSSSTDTDELERTIRAGGSGLHDAIRDLAAIHANRLVDGSEDYIAALMEEVPAQQRDSRWHERYAEIGRAVSSAQRKYAPILNEDSMQVLAQAFAYKEPAFTPAPLAQMKPPLSAPKSDEELDASVTVMRWDDVNDPNNLSPEMAWLVPGIIPRRGIVSVAGDSGSGKSTLVRLMCAALSCGRPELMGWPEHTRGGINILYLGNEEQEEDLRRSFHAMALYYGLNAAQLNSRVVIRGVTTPTGEYQGPLAVVTRVEGGDAHVNEAGMEEMKRLIVRYDISLVVVDPYNRVATGIEENSATATEIVTSALSEIAYDTGALVMHIHHAPKDNNKLPNWYKGGRNAAWRGSGAIYSALEWGGTVNTRVPENITKPQDWKRELAKHPEYGAFMEFDPSGKAKRGVPAKGNVFRMVGVDVPAAGGKVSKDVGLAVLSSDIEAETFAARVARGQPGDADDDEEPPQAEFTAG